MATENNIEGAAKDSARLGRLHHELQIALGKFHEYEEAHGGGEEEPAVRAARFNAFVRRHFAHIRDHITPDICETYLDRYKYIALPLDEEPEEPLTAKERLGKAALAYREFRSDTGFEGSREAEAIAFHDYIHAKYPRTLSDFTQEEADGTIAACHGKRDTLFWGIVMTVACSLGLGIAMMSPSPNRESDFEPQQPVRQKYDVNDAPRIVPVVPAIQPLDQQPAWNQPADDGKWRERIADPKLREQIDREWRRRHGLRTDEGRDGRQGFERR